MKTIFRTLALSAAFLSMFTACQREELEQNQEPETPKTHTVTFVAGSPETKTTVDISDGKTAKFAWTADDVVRFNLYENSTRADCTQGTLTNGIMTIKAEFEGGASTGENTYIAVLNSANDLQILYKEAYAEDADILVSKAVTSFNESESVLLQFKREVAIAKMTLKGLDPGEVVNHITVSSTADIAGSYGVEGWYSTKKYLDIYSAKALADQETYSIVANESGEAVVWFTCIPQDAATLTVKVEAADGDTYTKEFGRAITLERGDVKAFGVAMAKDLKKETVYTLVESAPEDWSGEYVLVATNSDINYALDMSKASSDWGICSSVTIEDKVLSTRNAGMIVTVEKGTKEGSYSIKSSDGNYLSASAKGKFNFSSTYSSIKNDFEFTIDKSTQIVTVAQASSTTNPKRNLRYNHNGGNGGFRWYDGTTGSSPKFYSLSGQKYILPSPEGISVNSETKRVSWDAVDGAASYVLTIGSDEFSCETNLYDAKDIADEYYDVTVVAVPSDTENYKNSDAATLPAAKFGTPTLETPTLNKGSVDEFSVNATWTVDLRAKEGYNCELYQGETKVGESKTVKTGSVKFDGLDDGVTYTLKVNAIAVNGTKAYAASPVAETELTTKGTVTLSQITEAGTYTVKNVTVYAFISNSTAVIGDGTAYFYLYKSGHGLKVGNTFTVKGNVKAYNGVWEFDNPTISNNKTGSTPKYENAVEADEAYLTSYASAPITEYIHAKGTQSGQNITVGSQKLYLSTANSATNGKDVEVYGFVYGYNSSSKYAYFYATSITEDHTAPKLSVTPTSKTWKYNETGAFEINVTTNTEGVKDWTVSPETLDWASLTVDKKDGTITITPNGENRTGAAYQTTLTVTHSADATLKQEISLTQETFIAVTGVSLDQTLSLAVDKTAKLKATVNPSNATNQKVTWSSNKESVATVDENGVVTAVAKGTATITVTTEDGGHTATCTVSVGGEVVTLFAEGFGSNTSSAREWNDSYKQQSGIQSVYQNASYTMTNVKQSKYNVGRNNTSGLAQSTQNVDAVFEIKGLNVSAYSNLTVSYYWKAASIGKKYSTSLYYSIDGGINYTEVTKDSGQGATTFVEVKYTLPADAVSSNLSLKVVFNTSNAQAVIDDFVLKGTN